MTLVWLLGYFLSGACCFAYRCYIEPELFKEIGSPYRSFGHTEYYHEARIAAFVVWPLWLAVYLLSSAGRNLQMAGQRRLARAEELEAERRDQEREIERIIREAKL